MKEKDAKIVGKSAKTAIESNTSVSFSCGCGSANSLTTRKSKKIGISRCRTKKNKQGLALENNINKKK